MFAFPRVEVTGRQGSSAAQVLAWRPTVVSGNLYNTLRRYFINGRPLVLDGNSVPDWHCADAWKRADAFAEGVRDPPFELIEKYFKCRKGGNMIFVESVGIAFGNTEIINLVLLSFLMIVVVRLFRRAGRCCFQDGTVTLQSDLDETKDALIWHVHHTGELPESGVVGSG